MEKIECNNEKMGKFVVVVEQMFGGCCRDSYPGELICRNRIHILLLILLIFNTGKEYIIYK